ncbi:hypothetical protein JZ751_022881, partial [Albula glossodonta]
MLVCKPTALAQFLLQRCGSFAQLSPTPWPWGDPHIQTLSSLVGPLKDSAGVRFARDHLQVRDGGVVGLDWAVGLKVEQQRGVKRHSSCPPVLILIPNSWGRVTPHLLRLCALALQQGFYPVVFHRRGQGDCPLVTPRFQEFGDPSDLIQAVTYIRNRHPTSALVAVSEGSGSGLLLSYLGECGSSSYFTAAACLSPVLQGRMWFEMPLPPLYRWAVLLYRKIQLSRYAGALSAVMDVEQLLHCSSQRDLEAIIFCSERSSGHAGISGGQREKFANGGSGGQSKGRAVQKEWDDYWERNEPLRDADEVAVPVLCLCSLDDPLLPPTSALPMPLFRNSPFFLLALTPHGGHCGFASGEEDGEQRDGAALWSHRVVLEYFQVIGDFLREEERKTKGPTGMGGSPEPRRRTKTMMPRRRRATMLKRDRPTGQ